MIRSLGKVALVTGANKGIGFEVARQLAAQGCTALLGARNIALGEEAAARLRAQGLDARFVRLDLSDAATIEGAAGAIEAEFGRLDILVNNAGIAVAGDGYPSASTREALENTMQTNFYGAVAVTQAMLPLLRRADSARIVNVSSGLGSLTSMGDWSFPYAEYKSLAYSASKAALNMFTVQLAYELRNTKIKVNSADPGYTATDLNGHSGPQTIPEGAAETIRLALLEEGGPTGSFSNTDGVVAW